jgi:hypothetical protein
MKFKGPPGEANVLVSRAGHEILRNLLPPGCPACDSPSARLQSEDIL